MNSYLRHLPNIITIGRMLSLVPLVWLMLQKNYTVALLVAVIAGLSDGVDGFLAKRYGWEGRLGSILDPLADKLMMLCCFSVFVYQGHFPLWLFILVVGRDVVIILGTTYVNFRVGRLKAATPTLVSKANTALQIILILTLLLTLSSLYDFSAINQILFMLVAVLTVISGIHYVWMGIQIKRQMNRSKRSK